MKSSPAMTASSWPRSSRATWSDAWRAARAENPAPGCEFSIASVGRTGLAVQTVLTAVGRTGFGGSDGADGFGGPNGSIGLVNALALCHVALS